MEWIKVSKWGDWELRIGGWKMWIYKKSEKEYRITAHLGRDLIFAELHPTLAKAKESAINYVDKACDDWIKARKEAK